MKNKILTLLIFGMILLSLSSVIALDNWGIGKQDANFTINQICNDANYITFSTIQFPDKSVQIINTNMTFIGGGSFQYNFSNTSQLGRYDACGISDGCENTFCGYFEITPSGTGTDTGESIIYFILVFFLIGLDILIFYFIMVLPSSNERDDEERFFKIVKLKYLRVVLMGIFYPMVLVTLNLVNGLAVNFASLTIFAGVIGFLFETLLRGAFIYTIIIVIWIFIMLIRDTNFKKLMSRHGYVNG